MVINRTSQKVTASSGTGQVNTGLPVMGLARQVIVSPATETTLYDFSIIDSNGITVLYFDSFKGTAAQEVTVPLLGILTLKVENSTVDELFNFHIITEE
jgi:hypothetical protein